MIFIAGLGNPGPTYQHTRHNAGFSLVDFMAANWPQQPALKFESKWNAEVSRGSYFTLIKPQTFMNNSGQAVRAVIQFYDKEVLQSSSPLNQVWVAFDDLDLPLGEFKIQLGKGPKVHNGLNSVYEHLKTDQFWHVRLGIDGRGGVRNEPGSAYVLQAFNPTEQPQFQAAIKAAAAQLQTRVESLVPERTR